MKSRITVSVLLLMAVLRIATAQPGTADDKAKDEAAIREVASALETAHNKHDAKALAAIFAPDGEFTSVKGMTAVGPKAIEVFHRPLCEGDTSKGHPSFKDAILKNDNVRVRFIRPDVASVDILWTQTGSVAPDGKDRGTRKGLMSWAVTKEKDVWHVAVMHNMDLPVAK